MSEGGGGMLVGTQVIVLLGLPGSGKGTQGIKLAAASGHVRVSTGDLFRTVVAKDGQFSARLKAHMDAGELVPDELTLRLVLSHLDSLDSGTGLILDGFPRTLEQADELTRRLTARGLASEAVLIDVSEEELIRRLSGRRICEVAGHPVQIHDRPPRIEGICDLDGSHLVPRHDDQPEVVRTRIERQGRSLIAVAAFYDRLGLLHRVDGNRDVSQVTDAIVDALAAAMPSEADLPEWIHPDLAWIIGLQPRPSGPDNDLGEA